MLRTSEKGAGQFKLRRKTMKKLITIVTLAAAVIATPAFAQYNPGPDTGSASNQFERTHGFYAADSGSQMGQIAVDKSGLHAFAMVPSVQSDSNRENPALTGGGSNGYNEKLDTEQW
jgi:opacity protein-like surface antigen